MDMSADGFGEKSRLGALLERLSMIEDTREPHRVAYRPHRGRRDAPWRVTLLPDPVSSSRSTSTTTSDRRVLQIDKAFQVGQKRQVCLGQGLAARTLAPDAAKD